MKNNYLIFSVITFTFFITCCDNSTNNPNRPIILKLNTNSILLGDTLIIHGYNFGMIDEFSYVAFNNIPANYYSAWNDSVIKLPIPSDASSGKVYVYSKSLKSNELELKIYRLEYGSVTDIVGNIYKTVKIGEQWWMAENLKTPKYRSGEAINYIDDYLLWANSGWALYGAYCLFSNPKAYDYGFLYNWYAVNRSQGLAPEGWHVPSDKEWSILINFLGGESVAGGKMKEVGFDHWKAPNNGATNVSGFNAFPGGGRFVPGNFILFIESGIWWSSTESDQNSAYLRCIDYNSSFIKKTNISPFKCNGYYVRCIKD